jgi:hypothetical protein
MLVHNDYAQHKNIALTISIRVQRLAQAQSWIENRSTQSRGGNETATKPARYAKCIEGARDTLGCAQTSYRSGQTTKVLSTESRLNRSEPANLAPRSSPGEDTAIQRRIRNPG